MAVRRQWARGIRVARLILGMAFLSAPAFAQGIAPQGVPAATPVPAPAPAPTPVIAEPVAPVAASTPAPVEPLPAALPEFPPAPIDVDARDAEPTPAAPDEDWYDLFDVRVFADAYFSLNYNSPKPQIGGNDVIRAFDSANGFSLAWAGIDISHPAEPVGGSLALRFGPSAKRYSASCLSAKCDVDYRLENVKQAFASWRPGGGNNPVTIDFGKFDTIYGAEVAESQDNLNYTRGVLYWLGQPAFHTGLRANAELTRNLNVRALVVNGWNNTVDNNSGKSFGLQATAHAARTDSHDWFSVSVGYLGGPERDDTVPVTCPAGSVFAPSSSTGCSVSTAPGAASGTLERPVTNTSGWRHFVDLLLTSDPTEQLHLVLNASYGHERTRKSVLSSGFVGKSWLGAMLAARYTFADQFAAAGRVEVYHDRDGATTGAVNGLPITQATIETYTLTLDYLPTKHLTLRLDNRLDASNKKIFPKGIRELSGTLFTTTLGVVVSTN